MLAPVNSNVMRRILMLLGIAILGYIAVFVYDSFLHPFSELGDSISIGESYESVDRKIGRFLGQDPGYVLERGSKEFSLSGENVGIARQIYLRHDRVLMDVHLQVLFNEKDEVSRVLLKSG